MDKIPITAAGYARAEKELKNLKTVERPAVIEAIAVAREHGDLKENAEYHAAREKQSFIEGRILMLEDLVSRAEVVEVAKLSGSKVKFGARVKLVDDSETESSYQIVGEYEADLDKGLISFTSPLAKGLMGKEEGDMVEIRTPSGVREYELLEVKFA